jgi:hypothetical protein
MKRFILACLLITTSGSLFSMQRRIELVTGHPCLPVDVYRNVYSELLDEITENPHAKLGLQEFITNRLKETQEALNNKIAPKLQCKTLAKLVAVHMINHGYNARAAAAIDMYGELVSDLFALAIRKKLGVRISEQTDLEPWELKAVDTDQFVQLFKEAYNQKEALGAALIEEIHAHNQFNALAGFLKAKY